MEESPPHINESFNLVCSSNQLRKVVLQYPALLPLCLEASRLENDSKERNLKEYAGAVE